MSIRVKDVYWEPSVKAGCPICGNELTLSALLDDPKSMHSGKKLCSVFSHYTAKCSKCGLSLNVTAALDVINSGLLPYWEKVQSENRQEVLNLNENRVTTGGFR
jgi:transcription elongation factor Elf1